MAHIKQQSYYLCSTCQHKAKKWQGQCPSCASWNTFKERTDAQSYHQTPSYSGFSGLLSSVQTLNDVVIEQTPRLSSGSSELDRTLGGGFVPGSAVLLGGSPGAGKSTILLQTSCHVAETVNTLYVSGEESLQQIASRAQRLQLPTHRLKLLSETSIEKIISIAEHEKPGMIVIDSIQVMHLSGIETAPGGVAQVRESAAFLTRYAKQSNAIVLLVGHVTKDHSLAGPMTLSHIIDTQLILQNTDDSRFRMIRATKNRFGQVNELGIFAMTERGLKEVKNPSAIFLNRPQGDVSGSIVNVLWEGTRPLLVELQALVADAQLGHPRRITVGVDQNRISMLLAILARHGNISAAHQDVFVNVVGGIRINETSADLPCLLAIVSSLLNKILPRHMMAYGEVGLSGEIRPIANGQERIIEAIKHGFTHMIVPHANIPRTLPKNIKITGVRTLKEVLDVI